MRRFNPQTRYLSVCFDMRQHLYYCSVVWRYHHGRKWRPEQENIHFIVFLCLLYIILSIIYYYYLYHSLIWQVLRMLCDILKTYSNNPYKHMCYKLQAYALLKCFSAAIWLLLIHSFCISVILHGMPGVTYFHIPLLNPIRLAILLEVSQTHSNLLINLFI